MGQNTIATRAEIDEQVRGMIMQLQCTGFSKNYPSFAEAMEQTDMWTYIYHQAEVLATAYAANRKLDTILHKNM